MSIDFTGMTLETCPNGCTEERCVISTVGVCKHPVFASDQGCGPITLANRHAARSILGIVVAPNDGDTIR
ncbi:hypothetical protein [Bradyrhizobium sp. STM 3557]|uniref:hypothetical protein n=1 Tax=Bradyrhizobium sp. STM 3557 TaxID=578920 RepID=UPI0038901D75